LEGSLIWSTDFYHRVWLPAVADMNQLESRMIVEIPVDLCVADPKGNIPLWANDAGTARLGSIT
jgi:hypothetical protein